MGTEFQRRRGRGQRADEPPEHVEPDNLGREMPRLNPLPPLTSSASTSEDRRTAERSAASEETAQFLYGRIVDLSTSGMQLLRDEMTGHTVGDMIDATLSYGRFRLDLTVQVIWVKDVSPHEQLLGLEFINLDPDAEVKLQSIVDELADDSGFRNWLKA